MAKALHNSRGWLITCPACGCCHCFFDDGRWTFNGDVDNPTFSPSMLVYQNEPEKRCHSFVRNGKIEYLSDCGHALAGQTVELPEF